MHTSYAMELKRLEEALEDGRNRQTFVARLIRELAEVRVAISRIEARQELLSDMLAAGSLADEPAAAFSDADLPKELKISADHKLDADAGFYWLEHNGEGVAFRWTGPNTVFEFGLVVSRAAPMLIKIEMMSTVDDKNIDEAQCFVDGKRVDVSSARDENGAGFVLQCIAPPRSRPGLTALKVYTPYVRSASGDDRAIGVAFSSLSVQIAESAILPNLAVTQKLEAANSPSEPASGLARGKLRKL
ncbi:MAG: hypothetical protein ABMA14_00170 [Hyphomonadaceae bacterium]